MIDLFDLIAFVVFAVLLVVFVVIVVMLGSLPGSIARKRGHPQAAAINVASWLGVATLGVFWPLALIWAFLNPSSAPAATGAALNEGPRPAASADARAALAQLQAQVDELKASLRVLHAQKESNS